MTKPDRSNSAAVSFRDVELETWLTEQKRDGESLGLTAKKLLQRYRRLASTELRRLNLSEAEVMLLLDVSNGTFWEASSIPLLYAEVEEGLQDGLAEKWQVDGAALVTQLRLLSLGQTYALVDGLERAWNGLGQHGGDLKAAAQAAGLLRAEQ